jgi:molybdate transport system ATP-binding protein
MSHGGSASGRRSFLALKNASFRLGERLVFERSNWVWNRDEHWAVVGPNGSGKSVFADCLRGLLPLVKGELTWHFRPPRGFTAEQAMGHVAFEDRKQDLHGTVVQSRWNSFEEEEGLSVAAFLSYERVLDINPYEIREHSERGSFERRRARAIRTLRIEAMLDRKLLSLSNGETQKVRLARALCHPLRLLVLDEPFAGLDLGARNSFAEVLGRLMSGLLRVLLLTTQQELPPGITHIMRLEECGIASAGPRASISRPRPGGCRKPPGARLTEQRPTAPESKALELVRLRDVTVRYGTATILENLKWVIRQGESWALLGPNGSGKTTVLSLIQGDHPQVYMNHVEVWGKLRGSGESIWDIRRRIGWVSPELHVHFDDNWSCLDVVASGFHGTVGLFEPVSRHQRSLCRKWLQSFGLAAVAGEPLYSLSAGLQRVVLLARALVNHPELLILDEPCQGLDPEHREHFLKELDRLIRSRVVTAIFVTHCEEEIPCSIRRVLRLPGRA